MKKVLTGTYEGEQSKFVGDSEWKSSEEDPFSLELKEDGKGTFNREGEEFNVTWDVDGEKFTMKETFLGMTNEYTGTIKDGKLHIYNGEPSNELTYEYSFNKK